MRHKQHPLSAAYPAMPEADLFELAEDIKAHGLHEPVTLYDGMVLDGWHRSQACQIAGVEIRYVEYEGEDPQAFVVSKNARRRQLTQSQKAAAAALVYQWKRPGGNRRSVSNGNVADLQVTDVAKIAGVSERTLRDANAGVKAGFGQAMVNGEISANEAAHRARAADPEKVNTPVEPAKPRTEVDKLKARIAELEDELAEEREKKNAVLDELEAYIAAGKEPDEQQVIFQQQAIRIRALESQVRENQHRANSFMKECRGLRKRLGLKN